MVFKGPFQPKLVCDSMVRKQRRPEIITGVINLLPQVLYASSMCCLRVIFYPPPLPPFHLLLMPSSSLFCSRSDFSHSFIYRQRELLLQFVQNPYTERVCGDNKSCESARRKSGQGNKECITGCTSSGMENGKFKMGIWPACSRWQIWMGAV